jgi:Uma2 family endonuclease
MSTATLVTAEQLLHMPDDGHRYELVAGEIRRMTPAGWKHGMIGGRLVPLLGQHVREQGLGEVFLGPGPRHGARAGYCIYL